MAILWRSCWHALAPSRGPYPGQFAPESGDELGRNMHLAIVQRVNVQYHLPYFEPAEMGQYTSHRLEVAIVSMALFTEDVVRVIHEATQCAARSRKLSVSNLAHIWPLS